MAELAGVAGGEPGERGRERDQCSHQPERGPGAYEQSRAREAALGIEVEVRERLVDLVLAPGLSGLFEG